MAIRLFLTMVLLGCCSGLMYSQSQRIDSLRDEINKNGESYDLLWRLGLAVSEYDDCSAYRIMRRCFELALSTGDTAKILFTGRTLGVFLNRLERGDSAIKIFTAMLAPCENLPKQELSAADNEWYWDNVVVQGSL